MREFTGFQARIGARRSVLLAAAAAAAAALLIGGCASQSERSTAMRAPSDASSATSGASDSIHSEALKPVAAAWRASSATPLSLRSDAPLRYVVKKGDTLWDIAGYYLRNPWEWPQLWYNNPQIKNPHLIYPGDVLELIWVNGQPRLTEESRAKRLEPSIRKQALSGATPGIPYAAIRDFLQGPKVVDAEQVDQAPYVVAFAGSHLIGASGDGVFVKDMPSQPAPVWALVHIGKEYRDPDTGATLGYEAIPTGHCTLQKDGTVALLRITNNDRETLVGDRLLPVTAEQFHADFFPHAPKEPVNGSIISVFGGLTEVGEHEIVTLDRGSDSGLDAGTVLRIMQAPRRVPDPYGSPESTVVLPAQAAGLVMVFKTSPHLSYALVMNVTKPVHVLDHVAAPQSGG